MENSPTNQKRHSPQLTMTSCGIQSKQLPTQFEHPQAPHSSSFLNLQLSTVHLHIFITNLVTMAFALFSPPSTMLRLGLGVGLGISAATLHPLSPFRAAPMQCQYSAPFSQTQGESSWATKPEEVLLQKQGRTSPVQREGRFLNKENMRQVSLGSVLGLVAGVGLRAFSKALVVILGMGVVLIEVCSLSCFSLSSFLFPSLFKFRVQWIFGRGVFCLCSLSR